MVSAAVYVNCLPNEFTQDDAYYIVRNEQIRDAPWSLFVQPYLDSPVYRPLTMLTYAVDFSIGGLDPRGFHLVSLLLHAAATLLLYALIRELLDPAHGAPMRGGAEQARRHQDWSRGQGAAFAAALLFAVHPIHTEAVAAAVGRAELLTAIFLFAAWLLHLRGRAWAAALGFLLALLSKESAAVFLALPLLGDLTCRERRRWAAYALYGGAFLLYAALRWVALGSPLEYIGYVPFLDNPIADLPLSWRVLNALAVAWRYLGLQLFPARLSADYSFNAIPVARSLAPLLPALLGTLALLGLWAWSYRRAPHAFLAGAMYLAGFALTSNVLLPLPTILGERLAYVPSAGLCLLAGLGWAWFVERRRVAAIAILTMASVALAARTVVRNRDWRDNLTLFTAAVAATPENAKAHHNLGALLSGQGDLDRARVELDTAYRIYPEYPDLLSSLGVLYFRMGDKTRAVSFLSEAVRLADPGNPNYDDLVINDAAMLLDVGRHEEALSLLDRVIATSPRAARAYFIRALLHIQRSERGGALADLQTALRLDPDNRRAQETLASLMEARSEGENGGGEQ